MIEVVCHCLSSLFLLKGNFGISSCGRSPHMHYVVCYAYHYVYPIVSLLWYIMVYFIPIFTTHIYIYWVFFWLNHLFCWLNHLYTVCFPPRNGWSLPETTPRATVNLTQSGRDEGSATTTLRPGSLSHWIPSSPNV